MNRTTPTGSFAPVDARAAQHISAGHSSARLTRILPAAPVRVFDAPAVLTTRGEVAVLNLLLWAAIALWLMRPVAAVAGV